VQRARLKVDALKWTSPKLLPRVYGNKPAEGPSQGPTVLNIITGVSRAGDAPSIPIPGEPSEPKQLTYQKPELPADLTEQDWSIMLEVLELVKRTIPTNSDKPPEEIFGVMKAALLAHFRQT
jgi:hypothetical protein